MITLRRYNKSSRDVPFRYVTALMIEARVRGFTLLEHCPEDWIRAGGFGDFLNQIIDWLLENFPDEFKKEDNNA